MPRKNKNLKTVDREIYALISAETKRQNDTIDLIASENIVSPAVREALGSVLTNKYSEGYPGKRYYAGNNIIDTIEELAQKRARRAFRLNTNWHVNVQALSGTPANMAVYYALLNPGDMMMGMSLPFGGHLTHGWKASASGRFYSSIQYGVEHDGFIDYDKVKRLALNERPKIIVAGATAYSRIIDFAAFAKIAADIGAYFMVDMAHIAGLVAAGAHPSPFPHADIVTTTTHKTMRGPRGAMIFINEESKIAAKKGIDIAKEIDRAVFPGLQGGPHDNQTAAIAVALGEALRPEFKKYGAQIVKNAKHLAGALSARGFVIVSGGTDNHLMLVDLTSKGISGKEAQLRLERAGIIVNRNTIPYDTRSPFDPSGIRIGTPAVTTRGMKEEEMKIIAACIHNTLTNSNMGGTLKNIRALCKKFPA